MIEQAEIHWRLNTYCEHRCVYCPGKYSAGGLDYSEEDYIHAVNKLQESRYQQARSIRWTLTGGEPLSLPNINLMLRQIKNHPSYVCLETAGGESWFPTLEIADYVDYFKVTHHHWQNPSVLNFIIDYCKENKKKLSITVPLMTGKILELKSLIQELQIQGINVKEQILTGDNGYWNGYTREDINLIEGRAADEDRPPPPPAPTRDPNAPDPNYVDLSKPPTDNTPSYTGKMCYAGVDYIQIDSRGFCKGSECGGRTLGNIFDKSFIPPSDSFSCPMMYCRSNDDRRKLRIGQ
jgi:organic radical activating enzyme